MRIKYLPLAALIAVAAVGCTEKNKNGEDVEILRLDHALYEYKDLDSAKRAEMRESMRAEITALSQVLEFDTLCDESLMSWSSSMPVEMFSPMTDTAFTDIKKQERLLGTTLANAKAEGLKLPHRRYVAVAWGRPESIVFNDSIALIALNHYLGEDSPAYEHWPQYKRMLKRPDMLVYDIAEAEIATAYPFNPADGENTVLSHILYEGALAYAKMQLVPDADIANSVGLSNEQLADTEDNIEYMWGKLAAEQMLYSTDADLIERLFAQLPYSTPISQKAPGRCVRVLGYQIVKSYVHNNKGITLEQLLQPAFYASRQSLVDAKYTPTRGSH